MRRTIAIFLLILLPFSAFISYNTTDENLIIAKRILQERANVFLGNGDRSDSNMNFITEFKSKALSGNITTNDLITAVDKARNHTEKITIYGFAAISNFKSGKSGNGEFYISVCKSYLNGKNPTIAENSVFEIVDIMSELDAPEPQKAAVDLLFELYHTQDLALRLYKLAGKKYASKYLSECSNNDKNPQRNRKFLKYTRNAKIIRNITDYKEEYILNAFRYSAIEFSMNWKIQNWENYKYPLIAYIYYCGGNMEMYEKYKSLSITQSQLYDMRGAAFQYVEYACKIFCLTNDPQTAILLLKNLPQGHKRNLLLKRTIRYLTSSKKACLVTKESLLLN